MSTEKHATLKNIEFNKFVDFAQRLTEKVYIRCLVQGNLTQDEAVKMIHKSTEPLKHRFMHQPPNKSYRINYQIPLGEKICRVKNRNPMDVNCIVMNYYQTDDVFSKLSSPVCKEFLEVGKLR